MKGPRNFFIVTKVQKLRKQLAVDAKRTGRGKKQEGDFNLRDIQFETFTPCSYYQDAAESFFTFK